jgi:glc operon protein GlcG
MLTLSKSRKIIDGAIQRARQLNAKISVAVCGRDGRLIAFGRMDGCAGWDVNRSSLGVATAAAITGYPSDQLPGRCTGGLRISSYANVVNPRGRRGGLPIVEEGVIQGGCGVSGAGTAEESERCARAGIAALNAGRRAGTRNPHARLATGGQGDDPYIGVERGRYTACAGQRVRRDIVPTFARAPS